MSFILKKLDEWAEIEDDEELMSYLQKLYGPILTISLLFPTWKRANLGLTFGLLGFYNFSLTLHLFIMTVSVWKLLDDFEMACLVFHYWLLTLMMLANALVISSDRVNFAAGIKILTQDLGNYRSGRIYSEEKPVMLEKNKRKELLRCLVLPGMIILVAGTVLTVPYVSNFNKPPNYNSQGVNMNLPIATYYPFPTDGGLMHVLVVMGQLSTAFSLAIMALAMNLALFRVSQSIMFEYRVLQYALDSVFDRAKRLFLELHPHHHGRLSHKDPGYQKCIGVCIKDCVRHHHRIQEVLDNYETVMKWPTAFAFVTGTGVIGLGLFSMTMAKQSGNMELVTVFALLIVAEALNIYVITAVGEGITTESVATRMSLYFIKWCELDIPNRRLMLNFQVGLTEPVVVKAGGIVGLNMETFSSIINSSYSFLNLVNTTNGS